MHTLSENLFIDQICRVCKQSKNIQNFSRDKRAKNGHTSICKQCDNNKAKKYYDENNESRKEYRRRYREQNLEKVSKAVKDWYTKHPEKIDEYAKKRIQRKLQNGLFEISKKELKRLYSSKCFYCGSSEFIQTDHIIPLSKGGRHSIGNLIPACRKCNSSKGSKFLMEWKISK